MVTGELKNRIDALWDTFYSGGISNPLDVIEQITYLMFIHDLSEMDDQKIKGAIMLGVPYTSIFKDKEQCRWSNLRHMPAQEMFNTLSNEVFPFIKNLHDDKESAYSRYMTDAIFKIPTPQKLTSIIDEMDQIYDLGERVDDADIRGDIYEYMLGKLATSGDLGQFRTPRHIIQMMVRMLKPTLDDVVCDPACGTAGFLVETGIYLRQLFEKELLDNEKLEHFNKHMFTGYDVDRTMLRIGAMNMMMHGIENPRIAYKDSLSEQNNESEQYTVVLANPPFKGSIDASTISPDLSKVVKTKKTELLFLALFLRMLRVGGRAAVIVPDGVLFGSSNAHKGIRREILERNRLQAVISMPSGVFKPYAGVSTAILFFTKTGHGGTDKVWFYDMRSDGFSLDDKRQPVQDNDIPDILERFEHLETEESRERTEQSFFVTYDEIKANDFDLSINKYKKVVYEQESLPEPAVILAEIESMENDIQISLSELKRLL
ncbi:type I restriction-modification system subunit M [Oxalobacter aliiformigenes]|uniref:site-specific DNA-methyltransferase (adenine-specific) n=1 Tax=Oxalobacter aliiformigenes TaxID=2946593 RepID=A0ABY7JJZ9_9BURK|nr:class I SAM-dependent DNA methyltransferase [Oxalobacter aliiformigenes]WAV92890.1 type I restriction-modification system subunit M [Oxalobacter aliiformigenes]WAV95607.1 type I restriction-modification system subunit M [Oxalobacter aliiformigenes]WAV96600.1 type I restriction-modification system subunit M [Oxalobacter aliiformigenes]